MSLTDVLAAGHRTFDAVSTCVRSLGQRVVGALEPWLVWSASDQATAGLHLVRPLRSRRLDPPAPTGRAPAARRAVTAEPPAPQHPAPAADAGVLPAAYGTDHAVLVARDPRWLFAYWEVGPLRRVSALRDLGDAAEHGREVLRVWRDGDDTARHFLFDVDLPADSERWHLEVPTPDAAYRVAVGLRLADGRFVPLVESNRARTPPAHPSDDLRVAWVRVPPDGNPKSTVASWSGQRVPDAGSAAATSPSDTPPTVH